MWRNLIAVAVFFLFLKVTVDLDLAGTFLPLEVYIYRAIFFRGSWMAQTPMWWENDFSGITDNSRE